MKARHYGIPPLPPEQLFRVQVDPCPGLRDGALTVRARDEEEARARARSWYGLDARNVEEVADDQ